MATPEPPPSGPQPSSGRAASAPTSDAAARAAREEKHIAPTVSPMPPRVSFSLAELWPPIEQEAVRRVESLLGARDTTGAVLACEELVTRVLASSSVLLGASVHPRDPAVAATLVGVDGPRYLAFRACARAARGKREITMREALECFAFAIEARRAMDRVSKGT
jgi:hypothetical protein